MGESPARGLPCFSYRLPMNRSIFSTATHRYHMTGVESSVDSSTLGAMSRRVMICRRYVACSDMHERRRKQDPSPR